MANIKNNVFWPTGYSAVVSKLLDEAGVPNFIRGDLLNAMLGCDVVPLVSCLS